jgi:hypothetical protein
VTAGVPAGVLVGVPVGVAVGVGVGTELAETTDIITPGWCVCVSGVVITIEPNESITLYSSFAVLAAITILSPAENPD